VAFPSVRATGGLPAKKRAAGIPTQPLRVAPRRLRAQNGPTVTDPDPVLARLESGDPAAAAELLPLLYDELKRLATDRMRREGVERTLGATGLVHEAIPAAGR